MKLELVQTVDTVRSMFKSVNVPETSSWDDCIGIFKTMDRMMGSAFHAKVQAMGIARKRYFEEHGKNAGFVKKFAEEAGVAYQYAREISQIEQSFVGRGLQNFSKHAAKALLSLPQEDREEFLENHAQQSGEEGKPLSYAGAGCWTRFNWRSPKPLSCRSAGPPRTQYTRLMEQRLPLMRITTITIHRSINDSSSSSDCSRCWSAVHLDV